MRLVTYRGEEGWRAGIVLGDVVVDAEVAARQAGLAAAAPADAWRSVREIIQASPEHLTALARAVERLAETDRRPLADAQLGPPIPAPDKIICVGLNYRDHAAESGLPLPEVPALFAKYRNALVGPADPIVLPAVSSEIDYEAELAVVIGRRCKQVAEDEALACVAGAMALNDVSARDLQFQTGQWLAGKILDTFAPCGPALVLRDEIADLQDLTVEARVNQQTVQHASTAEMVFSVAELVAFISRIMTLEPGDIIATGTPAGVGFKRTPPLYLREGDVVEVSIGGLGTIRNPVVGAGAKA
jgi:2-keto-4-pentenoate hydratase/2-oxohepta-3-ene-1,7-dioic acid hydratase in catechol pathway